jgi:hypothetical protein
LTRFDLIAALGLPTGADVNQRVPKKILTESGAPTPGDRRLIENGVEELEWLAALKPTTIGVAPYRDAAREYLEIAVLALKLRAKAKPDRVEELVHRAVPYPVVLITEQPPLVSMSLAHKRWSQNETGATVLDGDIVRVRLDDVEDQDPVGTFMHGLLLAGQPQSTLYALYQGWMDTILALEAAHVTGQYVLLTSPERAARRREALQRCIRLQDQMTKLRSVAKREKQLPRLAALNIELKRLQEAYAAAREQL